MEFFVVEVTWMDGVIAPFRVGGRKGEATRVTEGVLHLFHQDGEMAPKEEVASIPLFNVRKWERI